MNPIYLAWRAATLATTAAITAANMAAIENARLITAARSTETSALKQLLSITACPACNSPAGVLCDNTTPDYHLQRAIACMTQGEK